MPRTVTRRSVAKLAYAAPVVAVSMRLSARAVAAISGGQCTRYGDVCCVSSHTFDGAQCCNTVGECEPPVDCDGIDCA